MLASLGVACASFPTPRGSTTGGYSRLDGSVNSAMQMHVVAWLLISLDLSIRARLQPGSESLDSGDEHTQYHAEQSSYKGTEEAYNSHYDLTDNVEHWLQNHARISSSNSNKDHEHEDNEKNLLDEAER